MTSEAKKVTFGAFGIVAFIAVMIFLVSGPVGIQNQLTAWKANAYGSDWLVIQYTGMGEVQNHWELKNAAIHNEGHSDGIYFTTPHGVVHLSGHYIYVQNPSPEAKDIFLKNGKTAVK